MKVRMTYDVDDEDRQAIAYHFGETGMASRDTIVDMLNSLYIGHRLNLHQEYDHRKDSLTPVRRKGKGKRKGRN